MRTQVSDTELRVFFDKNLNTTYCANLEKPLREEIEHTTKSGSTRTIVFDLADVEFISSAFLRICLVVHKLYGSQEIRVENASEDIKKVFSVSGLSQVFHTA